MAIYIRLQRGCSSGSFNKNVFNTFSELQIPEGKNASLSLCLCVSVSLTLCLWLCMCLSESLSFSLCLSVCLCLCLSVCLSICLSLSVCLSVCLSRSLALPLFLKLSLILCRWVTVFHLQIDHSNMPEVASFNTVVGSVVDSIRTRLIIKRTIKWTF